MSKNSKDVLSESPVSFNELRVRDNFEENQIFNIETSKIPVMSFGNPSYNDTVTSDP